MTKVVYIGPYEEGVDLHLPSGASKPCKKDEPVDVPQEIVDGLIEQGIWEKAKEKSSQAAHHTTEKE